MRWLVSLIIMSVLGFSSLPVCAKGVGVSDPAMPIVVNAGGNFVIRLKSNPTTGFGWSLAKPVDQRLIRLVENTYISDADENTPRLVGVGGVEVWSFSALAAGEAEIRLIYSRSWEKDVDPYEEVTFRVIVK